MPRTDDAEHPREELRGAWRMSLRGRILGYYPQRLDSPIYPRALPRFQ